MVKIIVRNTKCRILNLTDSEIYEAISLKLSYDVQGFKFMRIRNNWDGKQRLLGRDGSFPIGLLQSVIETLRERACKFEVKDERPKLVYGTPIPVIHNSKFEAREYQQNAIKTCIKRKSGIVRMCTGSGKTFVIASLVANYNVPTIIYVVSIDLLYQMVDTLKKSFGIDAGMIGDGICDIKKINVVTIWSAGMAFGKKLDKSLAEDIKLSKKKLTKKTEVRELVRAAELLILDECQFSGASTFQLLSKESHSARHRFLFSGTPWRESGDDILLEATGGKKIVDVSASYLINEGYLVRPKVIFKDVPPMRGVGKTYQQVYSSYITNNDTRNKMAISVCKGFLKKDNKVLFLIRNLKHGKIISDLLTDEKIEHVYLSGSASSKEREIGMNRLRSGEISVIVASTIFDIGVDIPSLTVLINLGGGKSTGKVLQRIGRVIRSFPGKEVAYVVDFYDQCKFLREHSGVRYRTVATEVEFDLRRIK